jgi:hypothetical protein
MDSAPKHGLNTYRAKIELFNGAVIYSDAIPLYFAEEPYFVYPNPVPQYHDVTIITNTTDNAHVQIFNSTGMKVFEQTLYDWSSMISTNKLGKGIYLIRVIQDGGLKQTLKLIVY